MISLFLTNHIQWHFTENGFAIKLFFTWLLNSMYAAHELNFQLLYDTVGAATY
jgi:hypothetical protein